MGLELEISQKDDSKQNLRDAINQNTDGNEKK